MRRVLFKWRIPHIHHHPSQCCSPEWSKMAISRTNMCQGPKKDSEWQCSNEHSHEQLGTMWGNHAWPCGVSRQKGPDSSPELRHERCHGISLPCFLRPRMWVLHTNNQQLVTCQMDQSHAIDAFPALLPLPLSPSSFTLTCALILEEFPLLPNTPPHPPLRRGRIIEEPSPVQYTLDGPSRANRFTDSGEWPDSRDSFQGSWTEPVVCKSRFGALKISNRRFEAICACRSNIENKVFCLRIESHESICANPPIRVVSRRAIYVHYLSVVPKRGRSKHSQTQKHANERKKSANVRKRAQRALPCKNCEQPARSRFETTRFGTSQMMIWRLLNMTTPITPKVPNILNGQNIKIFSPSFAWFLDFIGLTTDRYIFWEICFQLQTKNRAARRMNFHYRDRSVEISS